MINYNLKIYYPKTNGTISAILNKDNNAKIENLEDYLALAYNDVDASTLGDGTITQRKIALNMDLKIQLNENIWKTGVAFPTYLKLYSVGLGAVKNYYFFINEIIWTSPEIATCSLTLDTINTFGNGSYFKILPSSKINRRHKDRFIGKSVKYGSRHIRKIDPTPEGLNPNLFNDGESSNVLRTGVAEGTSKPIPDADFYLVYKTTNNEKDDLVQNPINVFLYASKDIPLTAGVLTRDSFNADDRLNRSNSYIIKSENAFSGANFSINGITYAQANYTYNILFYKNDVWNMISLINSAGAYSSISLGENPYISIYGYNKMIRSSISGADLYVGTSANVNRSVAMVESAIAGSLPLSYNAPEKIQNIDNLDRTDSRIVKIIKIPYAPADIHAHSATGFTYYDYDSDKWEYNNTTLKLKNLNTRLLNDIEFPLSSGIDLSLITSALIIPNYNNAPNIDYESKLYNSEFYNYKILYDSFIYPVNLEDLKLTDNYDYEFNKLRVGFEMTRTINSKFIFVFDFPKLASAEDYPNELIVSRNNEEVIYSNTYLNYLRTGYNYDVKAKDQTIASAWINAGLGLGATVAGVATGNPFTAGVALSSIGKLTSAINTSITAERNLASKIAELKASSASVAGSDDVDLMSFYCGNRLNVRIAQPKEYLKNMIFKLFYYFGYKCEEFGIPEEKTRCWFDFIQAEINVEAVAIPSNFMEDIKRRYSEGLTIFHKFQNTYNTNQTKENFEIFFFE